MKNEQIVLIVDDVVENLNVVANILIPQQINVLLAQSGKEALISARKLLPDLILLDIMMPEMDGFEVCEKLKADRLTKDIPVIFLSVKKDTESIVYGFQLGAVDYIPKPFFEPELIARVKTHLDLKKSKTELEYTQSNLKIILNNVADAIFIHDEQGNFIEINETTKRRFGYSQNDLLSMNIENICTPENFTAFNSDIEQLKKQKEITFETILKTKNNKLIPSEVSATLINYKGKTAFLIVARDITERKIVEKALKESEEMQRKILDTFEDGIYINSTDYKIEWVSSAIQEKIGHNPYGEYCYKAFYDKEKECSWCIYPKLIKDKENIDYELENENGQIIAKKNILIENNCKLTIFKNITERKIAELALKESETKLRKSNETKDKFFSIIAHDLKSPFNTMLGFLELLMNNFEKYKVQEQKKLLEILNQDIQNTYKLLENLLLWSQSQRDTIDFYPEKENLYLISVETLNLLKQSSVKKSITLKNKIPENIHVEADKNMLAAIIRNLVSNAIKFTPKNGTIEIGVKTSHDLSQHEIYVKDNGVGMTKEKQARLFKISENISTDGTEKETGTGLGLILCKEFIEKHDERIWVESEPGKGSSFIFTLKTV